MDKFEHIENSERDDDRDRNEILSTSIRSGKRTYFFDLKISKKEEPYLTITESKRRFNENDDTFFYEKHKIFLLKQDLKQFYLELGKMIDFIDENPQLANAGQSDDFSYTSIE